MNVKNGQVRNSWSACSRILIHPEPKRRKWERCNGPSWLSPQFKGGDNTGFNDRPMESREKTGKNTSPFPYWCFRNFPSKLRSSKTPYKPQSQDKHLRKYLLSGEFQPSTVHTWYIISGKLLLKRHLLAKNWWKALTFEVGPGWICGIVFWWYFILKIRVLASFASTPRNDEIRICKKKSKHLSHSVVSFPGIDEFSPGSMKLWSTRYGCFHSQDASWKALLEPKKSNHPGGHWYLYRAETSQRSIS